MQHAFSKSHKAMAATTKGRANTQMTFAVNQEENNNADEEEDAQQIKKKGKQPFFLKEDIQLANSTLKSHDQVLESAMHRDIKTSKSVDKNAALETAKMTKRAIDVNEELEYLNKKLIKLISRKK